MWKKPSYYEFDINELQKIIRAKAWSVGQAMSYADLYQQGLGASGVILLPEGVYAEAFVAAINTATGIATFIVNGAKRFYNWITGVFS